jgi:uncharacterized RDD family membrane protein YckC
MSIIYLAISIVYILLYSSDFSEEVSFSVASLLSFIVFNFYFIYFELAWRGRTPGKALNGLMVINRNGDELTPTSIVARNLTRLVELYLPLFFLVSAINGLSSGDYSWLFFIWAMVGSLLPLLTRDALRLGDLIGGTVVITRPSQVLAEDLSEATPDPSAPSAAFVFTPDQLAVYGYFELSILEDILRRAEELPLPKGTPINGLNILAQKIKTRINFFQAPVEPGHEQQFLFDFYTAQRAVLERALLFGQQKWNQYLDKISISALAAGYRPAQLVNSPRHLPQVPQPFQPRPTNYPGSLPQPQPPFQPAPTNSPGPK